MASIGGGSAVGGGDHVLGKKSVEGGGSGSERGDHPHAPENPESHVVDMLQNINLTAEEEQVLAFSDDEEDVGAIVECSLVGKILSPAKMHPSMIHKLC
jgi:hypothetical protein